MIKVYTIILALAIASTSFAQSGFEAYNQGLNDFKDGDYTTAIENFDLALEVKPNFYEALLFKANAQFLSGDTENSWTNLKKAIDSDPDKYLGYYIQGRMLHASGKVDEAIISYTAAILTKPDYTEAMHARGLCYAETEQYKFAMRDWNTAIALRPNWDTPREDRLELALELGDWVIARNDLNYMIQRHPTNPLLFHQRAFVQFEMEEFGACISDFGLSLQLGMIDSDGLKQMHRYRAAAFMKMKRPDLAILDYEALHVTYGIKTPEVYAALGLAHHLNQTFNQAEHYYNLALEVDKTPEVLLKRAALYASLEKRNECVEDITTALQMNPNVMTAQLRTWSFLFENPVAEEALKMSTENSVGWDHSNDIISYYGDANDFDYTQSSTYLVAVQ